jgi:thymidine kinase
MQVPCKKARKVLDVLGCDGAEFLQETTVLRTEQVIDVLKASVECSGI